MYEDLQSLIERAKVPFPKFGRGVSIGSIADAEAKLGAPFPASYRWWLLNYGGGQLKGDLLYGLDEQGLLLPDIVKLAQQNWQAGFYEQTEIVFCTGNEENFLFDAATMNENEYHVIQDRKSVV